MSLMTKGTCLQLRLGRPGIRVKVPVDKVEVETDKTMLHVSQDIMVSPELRAIVSHDALTRAWVRSISVPTPYLRGGLYMINTDLAPTIDDKLEEKRAQRLPLIATFIAAYTAEDDGIIARARALRGSLFDEADYPTPAKMERAFTFDTAYLQINASESLKQISQVMFEREKEKAALRLRDAEEEIKLLLRTEFKGLVDGMVEMLKPGDSGKPKKFYTARIQKVADFLSTFEFRNIVDDAELNGLVEQARSLLVGREADSIKESMVMKEQVSAGFAQLAGALEPLVGEKPSRLIDLDEGEA